MERWRGRVAVVTGAGSGIGAAIAYQLQDAGLNVVGMDIRAQNIPGAVDEARKGAESRGRKLVHKAPSPGTLRALKCDVTKEDDVVNAFKWVEENEGCVDILVNCAGRAGDVHLLDTNTKVWQEIMDINVLGLSVCTREAVKLMRKKGVDDGHIVHLGSTASHFMPAFDWLGLSTYIASKHAVRVLMEGLRQELVAARSRIRTTIICPGPTNTNLYLTVQEQEKFTGVFLNPEDVADTVLFAVASPEHIQVFEIIVKPVGEVGE